MEGHRLAILALLGACSFEITSEGSDAATSGTSMRRKAITIASSSVTTPLIEFPVWIDLVDAQIKAAAQPDGQDLWFADGDGMPIPFEIQRWSSATGRLQAWVKVPSLAPNAPTVIYICYGDPLIASAPSSAAVFDGYVATWHLDDALSTSAIAEATGAFPGTAMTLGSSNQVTGKLGGGIQFSGTTAERIRFDNPISGGGAHTISAWVSHFPPTAGRYDGMVVLGNGALQQSRWFYARFQTSIAGGFYGGSSNHVTTTTITDTMFTLLHWVFDPQTGRSTFYRDGVVIDSTILPPPNTQGDNGYLGYGPTAFGTVALRGVLDEVRIAAVPREPAWIAAEFANQSSPSSFYVVGPEQL